MDVLLINPPYNLNKSMGKLARIVPTTMPIGLAYIASSLLKNGISVEILDAQVHSFDFNSLKKKILQGKPVVVGLTATTPLIHSAVQVAAMVKKISKKPTVVLGGCHPSFMPNQLIRNKNIDVVARGEAELTTANLVQAIKEGKGLKKVKGITYMENNRVKTNSPAAFVENLDELPFPARHLLPINKYRPLLDMVIRSPVRVLMTARGCPFNCFFCGGRYITGRKYRYYSTEKVMSEIRLLIEEYGARQLFFLDDNFVVNKQRTKEICNAMIENGFNKKVLWACESRVDAVTPELLKLMYRAGCRIVCYGIETSSQRLLNVLKKDITVQQSRNAVRWAKQAGLDCRATFMLGIPSETKADSLATIEFAKQLDLDRAKFSIATPYPGTEFYELVKAGLGDRDWSEFNSMPGFTENDVIYVAEGRTAEELESLQRKAMREFYLRPKIVFRLLGKIRSFQQIRDYLISTKVLLSGLARNRGEKQAV